MNSARVISGKELPEDWIEIIHKVSSPSPFKERGIKGVRLIK
jgi:hypothetical protein